MPQIHFIKSDKYPALTVEQDAPLMGTLLFNKIPVASSCHGKGVCSKCRIKIIQGAENLSEQSGFESDLLLRNNVPDNFRISCQARVCGDITIDTDYW